MQPQAATPRAPVAADLPMLCERCGSRMTLLARLPAAGTLPSIDILECVGCAIIDLMKDSR